MSGRKTKILVTTQRIHLLPQNRRYFVLNQSHILICSFIPCEITTILEQNINTLSSYLAFLNTLSSYKNNLFNVGCGTLRVNLDQKIPAKIRFLLALLHSRLSA